MSAEQERARLLAIADASVVLLCRLSEAAAKARSYAAERALSRSALIAAEAMGALQPRESGAHDAAGLALVRDQLRAALMKSYRAVMRAGRREDGGVLIRAAEELSPTTADKSEAAHDEHW